jgi:FkbH-like protein
MAHATDSLDVVDRFLASVGGPSATDGELLKWIKAELKAGNTDRLADVFPRLLIPSLDYTTAHALHRVLGQLRQMARLHDRTAKIAVLGGFTTHQLVSLLELFLSVGRVGAEIYEAEYGALRQEILDPDSGLYRSRPDFVFIATTWRDLGHRPELSDDRAEVRRKVEAEAADWTSLWGLAHGQLGCQIIQNNFDAPPWRALGNLEARHPAGFGRYIALVNHALQDAAPPYVTIHDVDHLAAAWGRWKWGDERFYHQAKLPCSPEHLVDYAHSLASLILAQLGLGKKCLVLDLDNTLWGGVIGDDGLGGIRIGQGDPESEAFAAFQHYAKELCRRGVILAVCSKNTDSLAREVFEKHPEMVLRLDDISCFMANWNDKATNLGQIAERLNIGLNSLVFVDDNPAERSIVRRLRPEVAVPELPEDPAYYIQALERYRYFQAVAVSTEDLKRTEFYRADAARQAVESSAEDLNAFLQSLGLIARVGPIVPATLERCVQLINRSNQFNLTTRRHSNADVLRMMDDPSWVTRAISVRDRFGDHGLISVLLAQVEANALVIDTWLMSCRVLKRGIEHFLLNHLVVLAKELGLRRLLGEYVPTAKNVLVRDHYTSLGFTRIGGDDTGHTRWELEIDDDWQPRQNFIRESPLDGSDPLQAARRVPASLP